MGWETVLAAFLGLVVSAISFLFGKMFSQSENILEKKREVYREFLSSCPAPNEAHDGDFEFDLQSQRKIGVLSLYSAPEVAKFAGEYFAVFSEAQLVLKEVDVEGHPEFLRVMTSYNRMIWAMRNDVMTWSIFAPSKNARVYKPSVSVAGVTKDAMDQAD